VGGRASARETVGRVAAGAVARRAMLAAGLDVDILAWVEQVADLSTDPATFDETTVTREAIEATPVRCPDPDAAAKMIARIDEARRAGDSLGGVVRAVARRVPAGWGEPVFDKLDADLAKAMLSLPAAKGFEIGSGFAGTLMTGAQHNDPFYNAAGRVRTRTNWSGGVQGGISNGETVAVRVAFKPTATIMKEQDTVDDTGADTTIKPRGRHDPCVLPRAVPIVEAMIALVLCDHWLRQRGQCGV
jgi:chorismate synthase